MKGTRLGIPTAAICVVILLSALPACRKVAQSPGLDRPQGNIDEVYLQAKTLYDQKKYAEAFPLLEAAAEAGNAEAQMRLGKMYFNGWGVPHDHAKAKEWHQKAAVQGNAESIAKLKKMSR